MATTVLIVEDHEVTADGLRSGLDREEDLEVLAVAKTSDDGLSMAAQLQPDVILLDLHLPGTRGTKGTVEAFCALQGPKVIVFSGEERLALVQIVVELGAAGFLSKSENVPAIAAAIRDVRNGKQPVISKGLLGDATNLTQSEQHILQLLARGMKYQDIANERVTSPATVRKQCELLIFKLGLQTREELIAWAVANGYGNINS